jgi:cyclohexadieny/prephenate dehydrogenase
VGIIGCGLIGGSIALRAFACGLDVVVYDNDPKVMELATEYGLTTAPSPGRACNNRELVILATPIDHLLDVLPAIRPYLSPGTIVSDVGSIKTASRAFSSSLKDLGVHVVPSHPMFGSEHSGLKSASAELLNGGRWLLCAPPDDVETKRIASLLLTLGASHTLYCPLEAHDSFVAVVSHFPQVSASLLAAIVGELEEEMVPGALGAAGSGWRDTTRIADSSFTMWEPILAANNSLVAHALRRLSTRATELANNLEHGETTELAAVFADAHLVRKKWREEQRDGIHPKAAPMPMDPERGCTPESPAWLDHALGYETIRTIAERTEEHGRLAAAFAADLLGVDTSAVLSSLSEQGVNSRRVTDALLAVGAKVRYHETWTADGIHVTGLQTPEGRFIVIA